MLNIINMHCIAAFVLLLSLFSLYPFPFVYIMHAHLKGKRREGGEGGWKGGGSGGGKREGERG